MRESTRIKLLDAAFADPAPHDGKWWDRHNMTVLLEPPEYSPRKIKAIRKRYNLSEEEFARLLFMSVRRLRRWEKGEAKPWGMIHKLLYLLDRHGPEFIAHP